MINGEVELAKYQDIWMLLCNFGPKKNWGFLLLTRGHFQGSMMFHVKLKESNLRKGSMHNPSRCN